MIIEHSLPLISVIVPIYNAQKYLERCVQSLLNQTYSNLEILLIDDGSTDTSLDLCRKLEQADSRVKVFSQSNKGIGDVRNQGLLLATGEYIGFVDSDDWVEPDMYDSLWKLMQLEKADIACCPHYREEVGRTNVVGNQTHFLRFSREEAFEALRKGRFILNFVWDKLFKRDVLSGVVFPKGRRFEDIVVSPRWLYNAQIVVCLAEPKYHYCVRHDSLTNGISEFDMRWRFEMILALAQQRNFCIQNNLWKKSSKKLFRSCIHLLNRLLFLPSTPEYQAMHDYCVNLIKEPGSVKGLGLGYSFKRYIVVSHWDIYSKFYLLYKRRSVKRR